MQKMEVAKRNAHNSPSQRKSRGPAGETQRSDKTAQLKALADSSPQSEGLIGLAAMIETSPRQQAMQRFADQANKNPVKVMRRVEDEEPLQGKFASEGVAQRKAEAAVGTSDGGLPNSLKSGIESLSGMSMDHVKVHYNSSQPAQLQALAYTQGSDIHVAPGQEQHLPHEAWHVVQQAQGRVQPTMQMKSGVPVNDDRGLEHEADVLGASALQMGGVLGQSSPATGAPTLRTPNALSANGALQAKMSVTSERLSEVHGSGSSATSFGKIIKLVEKYETLEEAGNPKMARVPLEALPVAITDWRNSSSRQGFFARLMGKDKNKEQVLDALDNEIKAELGKNRQAIEAIELAAEAKEKEARGSKDAMASERDAERARADKAEKERDAARGQTQQASTEKEAALARAEQAEKEKADALAQAQQAQTEKDVVVGKVNQEKDEAVAKANAEKDAAKASSSAAHAEKEAAEEKAREAAKQLADYEAATRKKYAPADARQEVEGSMKVKRSEADLKKDVAEMAKRYRIAKHEREKAQAKGIYDAQVVKLEEKWASKWFGSDKKAWMDETLYNEFPPLLREAKIRSVEYTTVSARSYAGRWLYHPEKIQVSSDFEDKYRKEWEKHHAEKGREEDLDAYLERKMAKESRLPQELETEGVPDLTLIEAVERSKAFVSALPGKIEIINRDSTTPEEIKESFKVYYSLLLQVEDEAFSERVGENTYLVKGVEKSDSTDSADLMKKTATNEDFANCAVLMDDRIHIANELGKIKDKGQDTLPNMKKRIDTISNQFLPAHYRRNFDTEESKIAFAVWTSRMKFRHAADDSWSGYFAGKADKVGYAGTALTSAAGHASDIAGVVGVHDVRNSTASSKEVTDNKALVREFTHSAGAADILDRTGKGFAAVKELLELLKEAKKEDGTRENSTADYLVLISAGIAKANDAVTPLLDIGGIQVPIVGTILKIVQAILRGIKFVMRWRNEKQIDEDEKKKSKEERSGLLGALQRTTARSKVLSIYSAVDLIASTVKLFAEIFAGVPIAGPALAAVAAVISVCKTVYDVFESSYAAGVQQQAKLALELNKKGADKKVLEQSDDFAVTAIIVAAKAALEKVPPDSEHVAVKKLGEYGIKKEHIKTYGVEALVKSFLRELERSEDASTLLQSIMFWKNVRQI